MKIVVFDLDQTLVDLIPVHDRATQELFTRNYGKEARLTEIDFAGRGMDENLVELGVKKGIPEPRMRADLQRLLREYEAIFNGLVPSDGEQHILPGARELLDALASTGNVVALYTGSSRGTVEGVFRSTGLGRYFQLCLFGTEYASRADMLRDALERANSIAGRCLEGNDMVVIGDSVRDVQAGKAVGARTVAVATGFHTPDMLSNAGPDHLFNNLVDTTSVLQAIGKVRRRRKATRC